MAFENNYAGRHQKRFDKTYAFMQKHLPAPAKILDLGPVNPFSKILVEQKYQVTNTSPDQDLDVEFDQVRLKDFDAITAFEIFEHMVAPFNLLRESRTEKLFASVPLKLWFSSAYWNPDDPYDRHYHEFEAKQFDFLLDKAGWKIVDSEKWVSPTNRLGLRPLLRAFVPRHYIVYCERK